MRWIRVWYVSTLFIPVRAREAQDDTQVQAHVLRVVPGNPGLAEARVTWQSFEKNQEATQDVKAYEVQYAVAGSGQWQSLGTSFTGTNDRLEILATKRAPTQRIFTRADAGNPIDNGAFQLTLEWTPSRASDKSGRPVTPWIPFDASAATMKAAIEALAPVTTVHVARNALPARGSYEWIVRFDPMTIDDYEQLPKLALFTETLGAQWTGKGDQVAMVHLHDSNRHKCLNVCSLEVSGLPTGVAVTFRVRAQYSNHRGWSAWSTSSEVLHLPATRRPRAPSTPELVAATAAHLTIAWRMRREASHDTTVFAPDVFPVTSFRVQQQCDDGIGWQTKRVTPGSCGNSATCNFVATSLKRPPGSTCVFRVAATNANGHGPYSMSSVPFTTLRTAPGPVSNVQLLRDPLRVVWETPDEVGGHPRDTLSYDVEYRTVLGSTWTRLPVAWVDSRHRVATIANASLTGFTTYVVRVRAVAAHQPGPFTPSAAFVTDFTVHDKSKSSTPSPDSNNARYVVLPATQQQCGNPLDQYYMQMTGNGGTGGMDAKSGEHGLVLVFPVTWTGARQNERPFFFTEAIQTYHVPRDGDFVAHRIIALDLYAWGAGGAGARAWHAAESTGSNGGGGAFARGLVRVAAGDRVAIAVGGGGDADGRGGFHGGGPGGTGDVPGGGGGGASEVRVNGRTVLVAAGGGGAGATTSCCAHGEGGGGLLQAASGLPADAGTIPSATQVTGQTARDEDWSLKVAGDRSSLSARHEDSDWGCEAKRADDSVLATGDPGATLASAGGGGIGGSLDNFQDGECDLPPETSLAARWPSRGQCGRGGSGQSGRQAGGGGGGGYFGGGGGRSTGAGGEGGSSFVSFSDLVDLSKRGQSDAGLRPQAATERVHQLHASCQTSSSVTLSWHAPRYGFSQLVDGFVLEMANHSVNEDFRVLRTITLPCRGVTKDTGEVIVPGLAPLATYRFRLKPLLLDGRGTYSDVVLVRMPPKPTNRWQRCGTHALDGMNSRTGTRGTNVPPLRRLPSARRGHTLTFLDDSLYLFGGMVKSYECSRADTVPCLLQPPQSVSNELWQFNLMTETWAVVPPSAEVPPPREKHSMATINGRLLLFGGRQNDASDAANVSSWSPRALNDLWELAISSSTARETAVPLDSVPPLHLPIPDGGEVAAVGTKRLQLFGPGSASFPSTEATQDRFQQDRRAPEFRALPVLLRSPEEAADPSSCTFERQTLRFTSTKEPTTPSIIPLESLAAFHQLPVAGEWTLAVTDTEADGRSGVVDSVDLLFDVKPCTPTFTWTNLTPIATGSQPPARFQHSVIVFHNSMFVYGGTQGGTGFALTDFYRLDYAPSPAKSVPPTARWTQLRSLTDRDSPSIAERRYNAGRTLLLTPYELMAASRGLTPPRRMTRTPPRAHRFESRLDVRLKRLNDALDGWQIISTTLDQDRDDHGPRLRYWDASVFVSSWPSDRKPRVFVFGGQDDTTLLDDFWRLELAQLDEEAPRDFLNIQRERVCAWRRENAVYKTQWTSSCGASDTGTAVNICTLELLLLYAWCEKEYQSIVL